MDLTKMPVGEMMIGFLVLALGATFAIAFTYVESGTGEEGGDMIASPATPIPGGAEVIMGDNFFDPNDITVLAGDTVTFDVVNQGAITHNMHIAQADGGYTVSGVCTVDGDDPCSDPDVVPAGESATLVWEVPDAAGTAIPFRCDFHPTDMTGNFLIVGPDAGGEEEAAE